MEVYQNFLALGDSIMKDITNKKFNRLTAIKPMYKKQVLLVI